jgi:hypothetical protein
MKLFFESKTLSATILLPIFVIPVQAENCFSALKPNVVDIATKTQEKLALYDYFTENNDSGSDTNINLVYKQTTFDANQSKSASSRIKRILDIDYSKDFSQTIYASTVPKEAYDAALSCLSFLDQDGFAIFVRWNPPYQIDAKKEYKVNLVVPEGAAKFEDGKNKFSSAIEEKIPILVPLTRNRFVPVSVAGVLDIGEIDVKVPAKSRWQLTTEIRTTPLLVNINGSGGDKSQTVCIELKNDEERRTVIVPGSYRFHWKSGGTDKITLQNEADINASVDDNERSACARAGIKSYNNFTYGDVYGEASALVWKAIPADDLPASETIDK